MTKRIIDGMTAEQIQGGWADVPQDLLEYLEDICKPQPNWEDDVRLTNPVLCWVSDEPLPETDGTLHVERIADYINRVVQDGYTAADGLNWKYARPISPDECWQPAKKGA